MHSKAPEKRIVRLDFRDPLSELLAKERTQKIDRTIQLLSDREQKLVQLILSGAKGKALANEMGVSQSRIGQLRNRVFEKMKRDLIARGLAPEGFLENRFRKGFF